MNKKYFSISEVCNVANISAHKLRYLETSIANFKVTQIRNRRYYTEDNIVQICKFLNLDEKTVLSHLQRGDQTPQELNTTAAVQLSLFSSSAISPEQKSKEDLVSDIDKLLAKLTDLT